MVYELKPCPFCGGELNIEYGKLNSYCVHPENDCILSHVKTTCGGYGRYNMILFNAKDDTAIRNWNRRVDTNAN